MGASMFDRMVNFTKRHLGDDDDYQGAGNALINDNTFGPWLEDGFADEEERDEYVWGIIRRAEFELGF